MKITAVILLAACLSASATGKAQKVSLTLRDAPLEKALKEIKRQTGFDLLYTVDVLQHARPITIELRNADLHQALDQCFKEQPLTYTIVENVIVVKLRPVTSAEGVGEEVVVLPIDVKGRVVDTAGNPVAGASVTVKGNRTKGTTTDENGYFELKGVEEDAVLVVSGVNIENFEMRVGNKNDLATLTVKMKITSLDETIVQAYGTTTRRFNTGSIGKVSAEEISKQPVSNPLAALQGRVPGLVVTPTSGIPGAGIKIQIRGQNSLNPNPSTNLINPSDNPLFIIDGVPFAPQNGNINQFNSIASPPFSFLTNNSYGGISPFNSINPSDIESIEILRDADATAIYGSRGANGVILITTKKAKAGKTRFNLNLYNGISQVPKTIKMMNTQQYRQMRNEAFDNDGAIPDLIPGSSGYAPDLLAFDSTKYTNWKEKFIGGTSNIIDVNSSISGGSENTQFLIGAGFHREGYIFQGDYDYTNASVSTNVSHKSANKKLSINLSANYSYNTNNLSGSPDLLSAYQLEPNYPELQDNMGNLIWTYQNISLSDGYTKLNPLSYLKKKYNIENINLISNFQIEYSIIRGLTARSNFGYNTYKSDEYFANPMSSNDPSLNIEASARFGAVEMKSWIFEPQLDYNFSALGGRFNILAGSTFQQNTTESTDMSGSGYQNDALLGSISGAPNRQVSDANSRYKYNAVFGRINYILNNRYIINLSGRRDGSSRFGPNKQFGNFGAVGAAWILSEESFVKEALPALSFGKIRGSYGTSGSDGVSDYQYVPRWAPTDYSYQGALGYLPQNLYNPDFSWAITKKLEFGVEFGLLSDRIIGNITWYRNNSGNQLVSYPLPTQTGFGSVVENWSAKVENKGWEIQLSTINIKSANFSWSTSINYSVPKNKLLSFEGIENSPYKYIYVIGEPLSVLNKFKYIGVNDTTGIFQFESAQKQPTYSPIDPDDLQVIGNLDPKFYGGILNNFRFKRVELSVFFDFKSQTGINYMQQIYGGSLPGFESNLPEVLTHRWQKPGDKSEFQMVTTQTYTPAGDAARNYFVRSSGVYSDASYLRLKTFSLSYSIPGLKKKKIQDCRIYINAQNLFTIDNYRGTDPETQSIYSLPALRTITAGIQLSL